MPTPQASEDLAASLQRLQLLLVAAARRAWSLLTPGALDASWGRVAPSLVRVTSAAQLAAATAATAYVPAVLDETGQPDRPEALIRPRAFAGVAYDGRPLDTLLAGGVRQAKASIGAGAPLDEALIGGREWLEQALQTAVADAARDATAASIAVRQTTGWVRQINPPCCSRCAVLAGQWYRWNIPLPRHPGCDCLFIPSAENIAGDFTTDPMELHRRGLIKDLSADQRKRIDEGADLVKVLNESRDRWRVRMAVERKRTKAELKRQRLAAQQWGDGNGVTPLPPGGIQDFMAHLTSRVEALNALKRNGIAE
jgi:hypothetical protein